MSDDDGMAVARQICVPDDEKLDLTLQQTRIALMLIEGQDVLSIAAERGMTVGTVRAHIMRATRILYENKLPHGEGGEYALVVKFVATYCTEEHVCQLAAVFASLSPEAQQVARLARSYPSLEAIRVHLDLSRNTFEQQMMCFYRQVGTTTRAVALHAAHEYSRQLTPV